MDETAQLPNPFEGWTTIEDAAEMVGRSSGLVRYWVNQGFITAYPLGRRVKVVNIEEVKAYSKDRKTRK